MPCSCPGVLPAGARFCPSCGAPVGPAALVSEPAEGRKVVTVLFCDLVGSTALSGVLEPETLRSITLRYFDAMRRPIEARGGTVEKFIGDAVMAVFGVPVVREDDARRALGAALGMLDALRALNARLDAELGVTLDVRIGVNTGAVVVGGDVSARQALVSGETVNVAARLEQNAAAGRILIGATTLAAAGPGAVVEPVGPLRLKGKADAVPAYRLLALGTDDPGLSRRFDVGFVGRAAELAALDAALAAAVEGAGVQRLLVHGEAGLGKTRLARHWLDRVPGTAHGHGRCFPYGDHGSLQPLADAVGPLLALLPVDGPAGLADAVAVLSGGLLRDGTPTPSVEETCAALQRVLTVVSARTPVVLVVDDHQWAPPLLIEVLDRLVAGLGSAAVVLLCLDRDPRPGSGRPVALPPLTDGEAARLAGELAGTVAEVTAHGDTLPVALLRRAGGNPLHLEHLLAAVTDGRLPDGRPADALPPTVQALLGARIDGLDHADRVVLDLASVVGSEFRADELAALGATPVDGPLLRLCGVRLVEPVVPPSFRFTCGLVQEVAYDCLSKRARAHRHRQVADLPSVRTAGDGAVGGHLERAYRYRTELGMIDDDTDTLRGRAAAALAGAGAAALARSDLSWAEDLLRRAVDLARPDEPVLAGAARRLGEVVLALGRPDEARAVLTGALAAAPGPAESAHARLALAALDPRIEAPARAAAGVLPVFEAEGDEIGQARACLRLAQGHQSRGHHTAADGLLTRALAHAVRADGEPERAAALGAIGVSLWRGPLPVPAAIARCRALLAEHGRGRRTVQVTLNCPLAVLLALDDDLDGARRALAQAGAAADGLGFAEAAVFLPVFGAVVEGLAGRPGRALALLAPAASVADRLGATGLRDAVALDTARLLVDAGRPGDARPLLPTGPAAPADAADRDGLAARIAAGTGRPGAAVRLAARAVGTALGTDSPVVAAQAVLDRARVALRLGRWADAVEAATDARARFAGKGHRPGVRWADAVHRGARTGERTAS